MPDTDTLVCSHFTLTGGLGPARFGFAERVAAAAEAGFGGIGLLAADHARAGAAGLTDRAMAEILADHGVVVAEVEFLAGWATGPDDPDAAEAARAAEAQIWATVDAFGPRVVSVGELGGPEAMPPADVVAERFAALCDRAAEHGTRVAIEFVPWTGIPDIAAAASIVRAAGRRNGGIALDTWHWFRGNPSAETLRSVADRVFMLQLNDADREVVGTLAEDTVRNRRCPGEGSFDLVGFLLLARDAGVSAPVSVEVMATDHFALPAGEAARRAYGSTRRLIERAWH